MIDRRYYRCIFWTKGLGIWLESGPWVPAFRLKGLGSHWAPGLQDGGEGRGGVREKELLSHQGPPEQPGILTHQAEISEALRWVWPLQFEQAPQEMLV